MKKKIALLLAAIMMFAAAIPMNVFADSTYDITKNYTSVGSWRLIDGANTGIGGERVLPGTSDLVLRTKNEVKDKDTIKLTLTNGAWAFANDANALIQHKNYYDDTYSTARIAASPSWNAGVPAGTNNFTGFIPDNTAVYTHVNTANPPGATVVDRAAWRAQAASAIQTQLITALGGTVNASSTVYWDNAANTPATAITLSALATQLADDVWPNNALLSPIGSIVTANTHVYVSTVSGAVANDYAAALDIAVGLVTYSPVEASLPTTNGQLNIPVGMDLSYTMTFSATDPAVAYVTVNGGNAAVSVGTDYNELRIPLTLFTTKDAQVTIAATPIGAVSSAFSAFNGGVIVNAATEATITAKSIVEAREIFYLDRITVSEKTFATIKSGSLYLVAPDGYSWYDTGLYNATTRPNGFRYSFENVGFKDFTATLDFSTPEMYGEFTKSKFEFLEEGQVLRLDIATLGSAAQKYAGVFYLYGLALQASDDAGFNKDLSIRFTDDTASNFYSVDANHKRSTQIPAHLTRTGVVSGSIPNNDSYTSRVKEVVVAKRVDYGIEFKTVEDVPDIYAGTKDESAAMVRFAENTPLSWWAENYTDFTLVDEKGNDISNKVKFMSAEMDDWDNLPELEDYATVLDAAGTLRLKDGVLSMVSKNDKDEISWVEFWVNLSISADYSGGIYLRATGRSIPTSDKVADVLIANAIAPVELTTKTTYVQVGYQTVAVEDITVKEAEAAIFDKGGNVELRVEAFTSVANIDISFIDATSVVLTQSAGDGLLAKPIISGSNLMVPVTRASVEKPFEFTISGLKIYIDRSVPEGKYDVAVGGDAFVYNWTDNRIVANTTADAGMFNVFGVTSADYIEVATQGTNKALSKNVVVKQNSSDVIIDKIPATLDAEVYVDVQTSRTMVPLRFISTALGIENKNIIWDDSQKKVTVITTERTVEFFTGTNKMTINGAVNYMMEGGVEVQSILKEVSPDEWRTYLPLYYIAQAYGVTLAWNPTTKEAYFNPTKDQLAIEGVYVSYNAGDLK